MAHKHSVYDSDTHLRINPTTRTFAIEGFTKNTIVQYDHNSERFTFELPRFIEGHDMLVCNSVQVHYLNVDAKTQETSSGVFVVTDLQESPDDENIAILSWLISSNATKYVGSLNFCIRFACISDENTVDYAWNTAVNTTMRVTDGINNAEVVIEEYADVLEQWKKEILEEISSNTSGGGATTWKDLGESETGGDTLTWDGNTDGLEFVDMGDGGLYKISDVAPTLTESQQGGTVIIDGNSLDLASNLTTDETVYTIANMQGGLVVLEDGVDFYGVTIPHKGFYMMTPCNYKITINGYTGFPSVKPIDTKYLPKHLQFGESEVELVNGTYEFVDLDGMYVASVEVTPTLDAYSTLRVVWDGVEYPNLPIKYVAGIPIPMFGNGSIFGGEDSVEPFTVMFEEGMCMIVDVTATETVTRTVQIYITSPIKIHNKYVPITLLSTVSENNITYLCFDGTNEKLTISDLSKIINNKEEVYIVGVGDLTKPAIMNVATNYGYILYHGFRLITNGCELVDRIAFTSEYTG